MRWVWRESGPREEIEGRKFWGGEGESCAVIETRMPHIEA
jgi:hypothetical protein